MASLLNKQRNLSPTRPPLFDDKLYKYWKIRMRDYLMAEDSEVWDVICKGPYVPTMEVKYGEVTRVIPKTRQQYNDSDKQLVRKNYKAKKLLMCGIGMKDYDLISSCESAKEIWNLLRNTFEGTEETRKSKLDFFTAQFEGFTVEEGEPVHEIQTRFSTITNELMFLDEPIPVGKQVSKILETLPRSWINECVLAEETKGPEEATPNTLFELFQAHELHKKRECLILKEKYKRTDMIDETDQNKENYVKSVEGKDIERDLVRPKISRREVFFRTLKRDMAAWKKSSSDSDDSEHTDNYFMTKSNEEDADEKVTLSYFKQNLNTFCTSKLRKLAVVLLDLISELTSEKDPISNSLDISQDGKIALVAQISDIKSQMRVLEAENLELKKKMKGVTNKTFNGKNEASSLQLELENKLHTTEMKTKIALGRNLELERDLLKRAKERHVKFVRSKNNQEKEERGPGLLDKFVRSDRNVETERKGPGPRYRFSKNTLPPWTGRFLVKPFDSYWELWLKWVPKSNNLTELNAQGMNAEVVIDDVKEKQIRPPSGEICRL
ncbi:uncharacterized protein LOC107005933 [Solanum pennellii]|uniref:Uncharacterized protein LOC107005933 n=1 Tax=Solanum pennellii TaxID=28526 RepID=A0ABM1FQ67_SOLPN|nr:uncharacterized protein LOC107005933 [Solanum pennellii]